jgi:ATP-dependent helicase/nuclease subunit B
LPFLSASSRLMSPFAMPTQHPSLYTIPPHRNFADALVEGVLAQHGDDLARGIILVPNNRAASAIQAGFVRRAENGLLLPRLVPIGDPELGEHVGAALDPLDMEPIPTAVDPLHRQLLLAQMLQQTLPVERMGSLDGAQAMRLAADLARVLDQLTIERKIPQDLRDIDFGSLSHHWAESLKLLNIVLEDWPKKLTGLGRIDLATRRNMQLERVTEHWRRDPPSGFVIAAGISTGAPAIADLVKQVAKLERGQVVFAGLDLAMPDDEWAAIAGDEKNPSIESHPQFHLQQLLDRMGVARREVSEWRWGFADKARERRSDRVALALAPARFTHQWAEMKAAARTLSDVAALELATPAEEAQVIALALREAIETPGRTAALITPDRELATRVSALLERWEIKADDSAGRALSVSPPGALVLALASAAAEHFAAVPLLALLKHPLVQRGEERSAWLDGARKLDLALRGPQSAPGLDGIQAYLAAGDERTKTVREAASLWWHDVKPMLAPLAAAFATGGLNQLLPALRETANGLAGDAVWAGQEGRALADLIGQLEHASADGPWVAPAILPQMLRGLMDGIAVRPAAGGHPRIFIWGLLEAKLQSADLMILGGLNEGVWPQLASADPWLAPAVRRQLGLPRLERRIGLSAHDLAGAMGASSVLMTRARRDTRSPTLSSRFWLRLETFAGGIEAPAQAYDQIGRALDQGTGQRATRPRPAPPASERPRAISVTDVDGLKADPFAFYAKKMLRLTPLAAPGSEPDAAWRGTFLHEVLADWGRQDDFTAGKLIPRLQAAFEASGLHPVVRALWEPRFEEAAGRFEEFVEANRAEGRAPLSAETKGTISLGEIRLTGQADRIDTLPDGRLAVVDYKTGMAPSDLKVAEGYALQLGLLGLIAEREGFDGVNGTASHFEYWSQDRTSGQPYGRMSSPTHGSSRSKNKLDPENFVDKMFAQFRDAVDAWLLGDKPFTAKLHPDYAYTEYDHLMRLEEWQGRDV